MQILNFDWDERLNTLRSVGFGATLEEGTAIVKATFPDALNWPENWKGIPLDYFNDGSAEYYAKLDEWVVGFNNNQAACRFLRAVKDNWGQFKPQIRKFLRNCAHLKREGLFFEDTRMRFRVIIPGECSHFSAADELRAVYRVARDYGVRLASYRWQWFERIPTFVAQLKAKGYVDLPSMKLEKVK